MKIALAALAFEDKNIRRNQQTILQAMEQYSGQADLLVFGETFLQGFDVLTWDYEKDRIIAVEEHDPVIEEIVKVAAEYHIAVSFGFIGRCGEKLYSSQLTIGADGKKVNLFRRVSTGWKEPEAGAHYAEGTEFPLFSYGGKSFSIGLCGDLWDEKNVQAVAQLQADLILWPVYTDFNVREWNREIKFDYAAQAGKIGSRVLLVNSYCLTEKDYETAKGGAVYFQDGEIRSELEAAEPGVMVVEV